MDKKLSQSNSFLFIAMIVLVTFASITGWFEDRIYGNSAEIQTISARFYDFSIFAVVFPLSLITYLILRRDQAKSKLLSSGITVYILFSYTVSVFTMSPNSLLLMYIGIIASGAFYFGKTFNSLLQANQLRIPKKTAQWIFYILLFSALSGMGFWFFDAITTLSQLTKEAAPQAVKAPLVLDMALFLPFTIYGAIRMRKGRKNGRLISLTMMQFFVLIGLSVICMELGLSLKTGTELDYGKVISYTVIVILNLTMAILAFRKVKIN